MTEQEWLASDDPAAMLRLLTERWPTGEKRTSAVYGTLTQVGRHSAASDRKLRLWACACVRQVWHLLTDSQRVKVVFAEKEPFQQSVGSVHTEYLSQDGITEYVRSVGEARCLDYACNWLGAVNDLEVAEQAPAWLQKVMEFRTQAALLRTIVGNPFRPVVWWPGPMSMASAKRLAKPDSKIIHLHREILTWKDSTVPKMAQVIYDERRWDQMSMLADALEDAGCHDERILKRLRRPENCTACDNTGIGTDEYSGTSVIIGGCPRCGGESGPFARGDWVIDLLIGKE